MPVFLLTSIAAFVVWLTLIIFSQKTRREQLIMSVVGLVLTPGILLLVTTDFRAILSEQSAFIGIEDLLFAFSIFGIAAVVYQVVVGAHLHKIKGERFKHHNDVTHWWILLMLVLGLWAFASLLLIHVFDLSSVRALIVAGLLVGIYIIADRHDLLMDALLSGLLVGVLVFVLEQLFFVRLFPEAVAGFWQYDAISSFVIGGVPIEEIMWAMVVGFTIGPMYEWLRRYELK